MPEKLPIIRLVDNDMSKQMSAWVSLQVLRETRFLDEYKQFEKEKKWQAVDFIPSNRWNIGVLGIGAIGKHVALSLSNFGYNVKGWSRSKKNIDGIECYYGESGLHKMLVNSKILICILPLTPETKHIISKKAFRLVGYAKVPGDKSISHRALIISSMCIGQSKIRGLLESEDVFATMNALKTLGVKIYKQGEEYLSLIHISDPTRRTPIS